VISSGEEVWTWSGEKHPIGSVGKFSRVAGMRIPTGSGVRSSLSSGIEVLIGSGAKFFACSDGKLAARLCGTSPVEISAAEPNIETPASV
jgi:hypothetical protein